MGETGLGCRALQHRVGGDRGWRIHRAAGEQIAVAGLAVQHRDCVGKGGLRRDLARGLAIVVKRQRRRGRRVLHLGADIGQPLQGEVGDIQTRVEIGGSVGERVDAADLGAQAEREAAIKPLPRIGRRDLAGRELRRQVVELTAQVEDRGADIGCSAAYAVDRHVTLT
ncbi:hypothetical protein [Bradyrhizobium sp. USDA 4473]